MRSRMVLRPLTRQKTTKAMIRKLMTAEMNAPRSMNWSVPGTAQRRPLMTSPAPSEAPPVMVLVEVVTSVISGLMRFSTSELTMAVNAPPTMIPTAMSITLPRAMNSLNSSAIFMGEPLCLG